METLLVLTDFSTTSGHAAEYACMLAKQFGSRTIVLYHSYQLPLAAPEIITSAVMYNDNMRQSSLDGLQKLEEQIAEKIPQGVVIRNRTDTLGLININTIAEEERADLIIMGTTGKTTLEDILIGSEAVTVCKHSELPVLLVPPYTPIQLAQKIVFACDMKEIERTIPEASLRIIFNSFEIPLTVLNVTDKERQLTSETSMNTMVLHDMLKDYNAEYYNISNEDVVSGILEFAKHSESSIILLVSKKHNFFDNLFHKSVTKHLAYKTPFPLLVLHEKH